MIKLLGLIFKNAKNLQDKKNAANKYYRIKDELIPAEREARKCNRDYMWRNKKQTVADKIAKSMEIKKNQLLIDGAPHRSKIVAPDRYKIN